MPANVTEASREEYRSHFPDKSHTERMIWKILNMLRAIPAGIIDPTQPGRKPIQDSGVRNAAIAAYRNGMEIAKRKKKEIKFFLPI